MGTHEIQIFFYLLLFVIAFFYSSVGHGGASGYLALMALFSFQPELMKTSAFVLNIFVAGIAFLTFYRGGWFKWKLFYPFAITSIPFAYIGSHLNASIKLFNIILAIALVIAALNIVYFKNKKQEYEIKSPKLISQLLIGCIVGFFSGMIGIGGGIILSPLFILFKWGKFKDISAVAALFVCINSVSGLTAQINLGFQFDSNIFYMICIAVLGGLAGSYSGGYKMSLNLLKFSLSLVLIIASVKLTHAALW